MSGMSVRTHFLRLPHQHAISLIHKNDIPAVSDIQEVTAPNVDEYLHYRHQAVKILGFFILAPSLPTAQ